MRKADVKIGNRYYAKVSGTVVPVRVVGVSRFGGWDAVNERSGRSIRIKTAAKLRGEVGEPKADAIWAPVTRATRKEET